MHFKTYEEAQNFAESVIICQKEVKRVLKIARERIAVAKSRGSGYNDSPFRMTTLDNDEEKVAMIWIYVGHKKVQIPLPEIWLECYRKALKDFKKTYGDDAVGCIYKRYSKGLRPVTVYTLEGISRRLWDSRRDRFMSIYMFYLAQENMISID